MCSGKIACKSCARKSAIGRIGRRRRKSKKSSINSISMKKLNLKSFQPALEVAGGLVASKFINTLPIDFVKNNPTIGAVAKIGIGLVFGNKSGTMGNLAKGVMVGGVTDLIEKYLPGLTPGSSTSVAGIQSLLPPRRRDAILGTPYASGIGCPQTETQAYA